MRIEMARWMDIARGFLLMPCAIILFWALAFPTGVSCQPVQDDSTKSAEGVNTPAEFGALADEGAIGEDVPTRDDFLVGENEKLPSYGIFNIFVSLALVLIIFWVIFRFVVRPLMRGAIMGRGVDEFRIIASLPIAPTKSILIIKLVDRLLVLGIAEGSVSLLTEITDAAEASEILKSLDQKDPAKHHPYKKAFDTILKRKDEDGFEDRQKTFNSSLGKLKEKIDSLRGSGSEEE